MPLVSPPNLSLQSSSPRNNLSPNIPLPSSSPGMNVLLPSPHQITNLPISGQGSYQPPSTSPVPQYGNVYSPPNPNILQASGNPTIQHHYFEQPAPSPNEIQPSITSK